MNPLLICNQVSYCMVNLLLINESHSRSVPWVNDNLLYQYSCLNSCRIKRKPVIATQSYMYNPLLIHKVYGQIWQEVVQLSLVNDYLVLSYHIHCPKQENHIISTIPKSNHQIAVADPGFPRRGRNHKGGSANLLFGQIFPKNCMKTKEIGLRETSLMPPSLDPPMDLVAIGVRLGPNRIIRNLNCKSIKPYNFFLLK